MTATNQNNDANRAPEECASVTNAMDAYLMDGVGAIEGWIGPATLSGCPQFAAAYMQGCAAIHGAQLIADALNKNTETLALLIDSKTNTNSCKKPLSRPS